MDLTDILPAATIMVVTVTATTTSGTPLKGDEMNIVKEACEVALSLDETRKRVRFITYFISSLYFRYCISIAHSIPPIHLYSDLSLHQCLFSSVLLFSLLFLLYD